MKKAGIPTTTMATGKVLTITLADGRRLTVEGTRTKEVTCSIDDYQWVGSLSVIPMTIHDVVLGKPWLTDHNPSPRIDFATNAFQFGDITVQRQVDSSGVAHVGQSTATVNEALFMNIRQARKELKRGAECIIVKVEDVYAADQDNAIGGKTSDMVSDDLDHCKKEQVQQILDKRSRCFTKTLPMRLTPERRELITR